MYTVIIIEDEEPAREIIREYLENHHDISLSGEFADGFSGLKAINSLNPDIIFLDIQMPRLTGFEMLELLDERPEIIFTTAYDQYAIKAFEENAVDYHLKTFSK
jgi:two-component system LytT family response regulator